MVTVIKLMQQLMHTAIQCTCDRILYSVDVQDMLYCVNKLKLKKVAGADGIMSEHIVYGGQSVLVDLCLLFNAMISHNFVPDDFGFGMILALLKDKNSDISKPDGYRAITLSPVIAKLFENILLLLYESEFDTNPLQFGFKNAQSCSHAIFVLKETARYFIQKGSKVYCGFLDASKVFDKVLHS